MVPTAAALASIGVQPCAAQSGYFLLADVSQTRMTDVQYVKWLASEHLIAAAPLSLYYLSAERPSAYVRFAVCRERATIDRAVTALKGATLVGARAAMAHRLAAAQLD